MVKFQFKNFEIYNFDFREDFYLNGFPIVN